MMRCVLVSDHAPVSKFLIFASSVSTFTVKFLPRGYRSFLLFNWVDITRRKQVSHIRFYTNYRSMLFNTFLVKKSNQEEIHDTAKRFRGF